MAILVSVSQVYCIYSRSADFESYGTVFVLTEERLQSQIMSSTAKSRFRFSKCVDVDAKGAAEVNLLCNMKSIPRHRSVHVD